jgi:hypothetical protein
VTASVIRFAFSVLLMSVFSSGEAATTRPLSDGAALRAQVGVDELKQPEYAISRCMLSPVFASDNMTVARSTDHTFEMGDVILAIGGRQLDMNAKTPIRDLLLKYSPTDQLMVKLRRSGEEKVVSTKCSDAKPFYNLVLEGYYAASKRDAVECSSKLEEAAALHPLNAAPASILFQCRYATGKISEDRAPQDFYDVNRMMLGEARYSADALSDLRGAILSAVSDLQKHNAAVFADDLKKQYDDAVAARSSK